MLVLCAASNEEPPVGPVCSDQDDGKRDAERRVVNDDSRRNRPTAGDDRIVKPFGLFTGLRHVGPGVAFLAFWRLPVVCDGRIWLCLLRTLFIPCCFCWSRWQLRDSGNRIRR